MVVHYPLLQPTWNVHLSLQKRRNLLYYKSTLDPEHCIPVETICGCFKIRIVQVRQVKTNPDYWKRYVLWFDLNDEEDLQ